MSDRPEITLQQIHARASEQSFSRGENYYNIGAVSDTVRRGDEIETWEALIAELREEHKRLPALKDELNKAGL